MIEVTFCGHGVDLRYTPRCFVCRPLSDIEMQAWIARQNVPVVTRWAPEPFRVVAGEDVEDGFVDPNDPNVRVEWKHDRTR